MSIVRSEKVIVIIAGPNGAGKTTFAREFLPNEVNIPIFLNADLIAAGLSPFEPERAQFKAARLMLESMQELTNAGESFGFETTLAGKNYLRHIAEWKNLGYHVHLYFLATPSVEFAVNRVYQRVKHGGHNIPPEDIARRFEAGKRNLESYYKCIVNEWAVFDSLADTPRLVKWEQAHKNLDSKSAMLEAADRAMLRAAMRAREIAIQSNTDLIIWRDGAVVHVTPDELRAQMKAEQLAEYQF